MAKQVTIGQLATQALTAGKSGKETLSIVKRVFPEAKTTMKSIYYYASKAGIKLQQGAKANEAELAKVLQELKPKTVQVVKATGTAGK